MRQSLTVQLPYLALIQELAGHKLSDQIIERLPTLVTLNPGVGVSFSEVIAFQNVIRCMSDMNSFSLGHNE